MILMIILLKGFIKALVVVKAINSSQFKCVYTTAKILYIEVNI